MTRPDTFASVRALLGTQPWVSRLLACTCGTVPMDFSTALALFVGIQLEFAVETLVWI